MLDYMKANFGRVVTAVQEKYGELTKSEIDSVDGEPKALFALVENKFGVNKEDVEDFLTDKLANRAGIKDELGSAAAGLTDSVGGMLEGTHEGTR